MKKISRKGLIKKLDDLVSEIVVKRDKKCVVCGSTKKLGNGHVFSRRHLATRWDITPDGNCHCQCWACNYRHVTDTVPYHRWYQDKFGMKKFDELYERWQTTTHYKTHDLLELMQK